MEKKHENTTRRSSVVGSYHHHGQYSELLEVVPVKFLKAVEFKVVLDDDYVVELEELKLMEKTGELLDQEELKAVETLKARLVNLYDVVLAEDIVFFFAMVWLEFWKKILKQRGPAVTMVERETWEAAEKKCLHYMLPSAESTDKLFDEEDLDIPRLVDLASTQLAEIKAYNAWGELVLMEGEGMNEVTFQGIGDQYASIYKGMRSLNMKIDILRFHSRRRRRGGLKANNYLVERFTTSVEGELRQYEEEVKMTRSKVFESVKNKDKWAASYMCNAIKTFNLGMGVTPMDIEF